MNRFLHIVFGLCWLLVAYQFAPLANIFLLCVLASCAWIPDSDLFFRKLVKGKWQTDPRWHRWILTHSSLFGILGYWYTFTFSPQSTTDFVFCAYFCISYASHMFGDLTKGVKSSIVVLPKILGMKRSLRLRGHKSTCWLIANGLVLISISIVCLFQS